MYPTRQLWAAISLTGVLAVLAVVTASPLLLGGAGLVGAWVLIRQYQFTRALEHGVASLQIRQSVGQSGIRTTDTVPVTLTATLEADSPLSFEVDAGLPAAAVADNQLALTLNPTDSSAEHTVDVSWPIAGQHRFDEPTVTVSNGFVRETLSLGTTPEVTVNPRSPRTIHVGDGGTQIATVYGEHDGGKLGSGLEPAELREYLPGDTADQIDWKATARLATPHVREFEATTDRRTLLVVDHRATLATGAHSETKLDYLREVALATAASARRLGDPLGLLTIGDGGVTSRVEPATMPATYTHVRQQLLTLEPTPADPPCEPASGASESRQQLTAAAARKKLAAIKDDTDTFATTLQPFYATRERYRDRIDSDPLYGAVRTAHNRSLDSLWTVIFTDDSRPTELLETVKLARKNGNTVMILLAPTVLYEPSGLADIDRAYDRYVEFEELRRELDRMTRVTALEVGPADRLSTVLSSNRSHTRGGRA
ncbi:DUF58 domain-containing protein [Natronorubrum aibiense]|uniref:DUF58 domain-containing protein n=1 Tax=Natronorubrum aibiense TaxID=348826 RepID=A0A5P9P2A4_9EURY|nr:DUF58 domain-containing protein [Natronorubrum aibiense]QFU82259.1 DUF58 domain-containing protein [Natronorubrum aibiense]